MRLAKLRKTEITESEGEIIEGTSNHLDVCVKIGLQQVRLKDICSDCRGAGSYWSIRFGNRQVCFSLCQMMRKFMQLFISCSGFLCFCSVCNPYPTHLADAIITIDGTFFGPQDGDLITPKVATTNALLITMCVYVSLIDFLHNN